MKYIITALFICFLSVTALADTYDQKTTAPDKSGARYYKKAKVLRIKYSSGEATVKRSYDEGLEEAVVNLPVFENDTVSTTDGRLEIYLGRSNYLRIDNDTELIITKAPELRKTRLKIKLLHGGIFLDINQLDYEKDIEIQTKDCGIFLIDNGIYRVNALTERGTELFVHNGKAETSGNSDSTVVRHDLKTLFRNGDMVKSPFYFSRKGLDQFDSWNSGRCDLYSNIRHKKSRYLESDYNEYESELSSNGRWRYSTEYNRYVWVPYNISSDWRPYYNGRWVWNPHYNYVWHSYDSWGWFTHHYGRWHWSSIDGWYWLPGYRWSGAWVSWYWDNSYYGWCPLSYYNRPVIVIKKRWLRGYNFRKRGLPLRARSTVVVRKGHLHSAGIRKLAFSRRNHALVKNGNLRFRGISPRTKPRYTGISVLNAKGRKVIYKRNGLVNVSRYNIKRERTGVKNTKVYRYRTTKPGGLYKYSSAKSLNKSRKSIRKGNYTSRTTFKSRDLNKRTTKSVYKPVRRTGIQSRTRTGSTKTRTVTRTTTTRRVKKKKSSSPSYSSKYTSRERTTVRNRTGSYSYKPRNTRRRAIKRNTSRYTGRSSSYRGNRSSYTRSGSSRNKSYRSSGSRTRGTYTKSGRSGSSRNRSYRRSGSSRSRTITRSSSTRSSSTRSVSVKKKK